MKKKKFKKGKRNYASHHHLIPKERVKLNTVPENEQDRDYNRVLMLWRLRHDAFHILFHNMTLGEIILVLQRIETIKYK